MRKLQLFTFLASTWKSQHYKHYKLTGDAVLAITTTACENESNLSQSRCTTWQKNTSQIGQTFIIDDQLNNEFKILSL